MEEQQRFYTTDRGWVDLSNLVYYGGSSNIVNWNMSIGKTVNFQYDDVVATLIITGRTDNVQYVYIDIPGYVQHRRIYVGQIRHGQFGNVIKKITPDFKYQVGEIVDGLLITKRYRKPGYKYYDYCCTIDQYNGTIREDHLTRGHGCPICHHSIGEKQVQEYLVKHQVAFLPQHTFADCKHIKELPFDFYLPDYRTCIEYDGIQHFEPIDFAGKGQEWARQQFDALRLRDDIKNTYCQNNHIFLYRIKYIQNVNTAMDLLFQTLNETQQND